MARFTFKLQAVLHHRELIEREKQRELAKVQGQMVLLQEELRSLNQQMQETTQELVRDHLIGKLDLSYLAAHRRYVAATQRRAMELVQKMALVQRQVDEARAALAEAAKQCKIMEKLREKQMERWQQDQFRHEMAELDEIGTQLAFRQGQEAESPNG